MNKLQLVGTKYDTALLEHTLKALSDTLRPVTKKAIARSFLKRFLGADTEHSLEQHISEMAAANEQPSLVEVMVINTEYYEFDDSDSDSASGFSDGMTLDYTKQTICTKESHDKVLERLIRCNFPDNDGVTDDVLNFSTVERFMDNSIDSDDEEYHEKREALESSLREMDSLEILDWLIDNFELYQISEDILPHVSMGMIKMTSACQGVEQ